LLIGIAAKQHEDFEHLFVGERKESFRGGEFCRWRRISGADNVYDLIGDGVSLSIGIVAGRFIRG
jgi:hypothetical protein